MESAVSWTNFSSAFATIRSYNWESIKNENSVENAYNVFSDKLNELLDVNCPLKKVKMKKLDISKPYITSDIKQLIKEKHKLQRKYNRKPLTYGESFKKCRNNLNSIIRSAKSNYFKSKIKDNTNSSQNTWNVINSLLGRQGHVEMPDTFVEGDETISDPHEIANRFNNYFANIGPSLAEHFTPDNSFFDYLNDNIDENFTFSPVTVTEVSSLVHSFKNSSPGYDDITMKIFKDNIEILADVITFICNLSFRRCIS